MSTPPSPPSPSGLSPGLTPPPPVPDHELLRRIGRGSYGEVWLARAVTGAYRAVKIVHRASFDHDRPFEREFEGILRFEPISRRHDSQVDVLHVGRGSDSFYYVMELADDQATGGQIHPDQYLPRTLKSDLLFHGRLPFEECVRIGIALATALEHLHAHGLVHRDVKPSNIIFIHGVPKLADIGLVTGVDATRSLVGTEGFAAPEGAGTLQADLYSLGKVLYEAATGKDRQEFPELPTQLRELPDREGLMELNAVIARACRHDPKDRYPSASVMRTDLQLLQSGRSLARLHRTQQRLRFVQRAGAAVTALALVIAAGWFWQAQQTQRVAALAEENLALADRAKASATLAEHNAQAARERLYAADIHLAHQALMADNLRLARTLLQHHVPQPGEPDLRGFEWRYLWHQSQSEELFSMPGHTHTARVMAFSPDGGRIAVGGYLGQTRVLDLATRQPLAVLPNTNFIHALEFSPDGHLLAVASDRDVQLWDARAFTLVRELPGAVAPVLFSRDGRHLLTYRQPPSGQRTAPLEEDWQLDLWDTEAWTVLRSITLPVSGRFSGARDLYVQPVLAADGRRLVVLAGDTFHVFSFPDLRETQVLPDKIPTGPSSRPFLALAPDSRTLATMDASGFGVRLWDLEEHRELRILPGHADHIFAAAFSPDGKILATGSPDQRIKLWEVATGSLLKTFSGQGDEVVALAFSPEGDRLASLGIADAVVKLWDPAAPARRDVLRSPLWPVGFEQDGSLVAFLAPNLQPVTLDPATFTLSPLASPVLREDVRYGFFFHTFSPDAALQAVWAVEERVAEIWDRRENRRLALLPAKIPLVSFARRQQLVATLTADDTGAATTTVWHLPSGTPRWVLPSESGQALISPDEQYLFAKEQEQIRLWRIDGEALVSLGTFDQPGERFVSGVAFSPESRLLATSGRDIVLWSLPSMEVVGVLKGHTRAGTTLAFSPDGRTLASMADDRTVRLWHVPTQRELLRLQSPEQDLSVYQIEFSPDGRALAFRRSDSLGPVIWLLHAPSFAEIAVAEGGDYRALAGQDPIPWWTVAKALRRHHRWEEALAACDEVLRLTGNRQELAWLTDLARSARRDVRRQLQHLDEVGAENCALLGLPPRPPHAPAETVDLSAYYNAPLADPPEGEFPANDFSELPVGIQTLAGTVFDVRGRLQVFGPPADGGWTLAEDRVEGIHVGRPVRRLHFLEAAHGDSRHVTTGEPIGHYRVRFADGRSVDLPLRYNLEITDWWALDHLPAELPGPMVAWRGANPWSRHQGEGKGIRLFKRTWENPFPEVAVAAVDLVAGHPRTHPWLIALTAE